MRPEYLQMIDQVVAFDRDQGSIAARSRVPQTSSIFEGHFPGHPIMPGVLLVEIMAQASGYLLLALHAFQQMPFLASIRDAKLRTFVEPEAELLVSASLAHDGSGFAVTKAKVRHQRVNVCDAELTFRLMPFPIHGLVDHLRAEAASVGLISLDG